MQGRQLKLAYSDPLGLQVEPDSRANIRAAAIEGDRQKLNFAYSTSPPSAETAAALLKPKNGEDQDQPHDKQ